MPNPLQRLLDGYETFREQHFEAEPGLMRALATQGQKPQVMVVACADSRVDPAILTGCRPGDLFVARNVAAIVPPYAPERTPKGTSSAVEFGVRGLEVEHLVVLGHGGCGGMRLLVEQAGMPARLRTGFEFVGDWVRLAEPALQAVLRSGIPLPERQRAFEQAGLLTSLTNLLGFPWIRERVERKQLALHAWYFDLATGELLAFDAPMARFVPAQGRARPVCGRTALPDLAQFTARYGDAPCCSAA
jgi:carbonic anhydrase